MKNNIQSVLLVDDDPKNLQIAMKILKDYKVIFAQSGEKALELLEKNPNFDLVLLDVVMPVMDGYETCKKIKANKKFKDIPVIFSTVKDEEKDIVKGFELGAVDYIVKPFFPEVLLKRVQLHLKLSKATKELKSLNESLNQKVESQIEQIRQRDKQIVQQEKIKAMHEIIGVFSGELKKPISNMKLYLQSLEIMFEANENKVMSQSFNKVLDEINHVEEGISDFANILSVEKKQEMVNFKVILDNVLFKYRTEINKRNIKFNFIGDNLLTLNIVKDELKQIFSKMLTISLKSFLINDIENKEINLEVKKEENSISIIYYDNLSNSNIDDLLVYFDDKLAKKSRDFDLDIYLLKIYVEKNNGTINLEKNEYNNTIFKVLLNN